MPRGLSSRITHGKISKSLGSTEAAATVVHSTHLTSPPRGDPRCLRPGLPPIRTRPIRAYGSSFAIGASYRKAGDGETACRERKSGIYVILTYIDVIYIPFARSWFSTRVNVMADPNRFPIGCGL